MSASTQLQGIEPVMDGSNMTTGFFNTRFSTLQSNILSINTAVVSPSQLSDTTFAAITLVANSNNSSYIRFVDSAGQRSNYRLGSVDGGTADGLNLFDESGSTMLVNFSKQSIRFYQQVVGPVFNTAGDYVHVATFGTGSMSTESRIQAAIDAAAASSVSFVLLSRDFLPYSAGSVSFNSRIMMVREGGEWSRYDLAAYGATGNGVVDDRPAIHALANTAIPPQGGAIYLPGPGTYKIGSTVTIPSTVGLDFGQAALVNVASGFTLAIQGPITANVMASIFSGSGKVSLSGAATGDVSVCWFGAKADGTTNDTGAFNAALIASPVVVVPGGVTCSIDTMVRIGENRTLLLLGKMLRLSGSTCTRPMVALQGDYASLKGLGRTSVIQSLKDTPDGVVLYGSESPLASAPSLAIRWADVGDLRIVGSEGTLSKGLALQSMQRYGVGALFDGRFANLQITHCGTGIYCNEMANGNRFSDIDFYNINTYAINVDGNSEGGGNLTVDNVFAHMFIDNSPLTTVIRGRSCTLSSFIGINAEPGGGEYVDMDSTCARITLIASHNVADGGTFDASLSIYAVNGILAVGASDAASGTFRIPPGTAPTSAADGVMWVTSAGGFIRINGADFQFSNNLEANTAPTFTNSWVNYDTGSYHAVGFLKESSGIVRLRGSIKDGVIGSAAFTLPVGYRPSKIITFPAHSNSAFGRLLINSGGEVIPDVGNNAFFGLDGISFQAS